MDQICIQPSSFLITCELLLIAAALFVQLDQNLTSWKSALREGSKKSIRILVVGESTSAAYFSSSEDTSWPRVLEKK